MAQWVRLCGVAEAPAAGSAMEVELEQQGIAVCLANAGGTLSAVDNWCPHRRGPLGQGWLEGNLVVCPWHSWTFDLTTGQSDYPANERVDVFPVKIEGDDILVDIA